MTYWSVAAHGKWRSYAGSAVPDIGGLRVQDKLEPDGLTHAVVDDAATTLCGLPIGPPLRRFDHEFAAAYADACEDCLPLVSA
jgi:hypothetical protein